MQAAIWLGMEDTLETVLCYQPWSILDVGIGFGVWGFLLRQYLDVWHGRLTRQEWLVRIDGVEIEQTRVAPHARYLYDEILIGRAEIIVPRRAADVTYDTIIFGDVLEHLPKQDGCRLLDEAAFLARSCVVVRIPLGLGWRAQAEHEADAHNSVWYPSDFTAWNASVRQYDYLGRAYGLVEVRTKRGASPEIMAIDSRLAVVERAVQSLKETAAT